MTRSWAGISGPQLSPAWGTDSPGHSWQLERQLAVLNSEFNKRILIDLFIWNDDQNSSRHIIYVRTIRDLGAGGRGVPMPGWGSRSTGRRPGAGPYQQLGPGCVPRALLWSPLSVWGTGCQ